MTRTPVQSKIELLSAGFSLLETPFRGADRTLEQAAQHLGDRVGVQAAKVLASGRRIDDYVICSTALSPFLTDDEDLRGTLRDGIRAGCGLAPDMLVNAYECAGWGYTLRYALAKAQTAERRLLLQIVDADIHDFSFWAGNGRWGRSGFAITTLEFSLRGGEISVVHADHAPADVAFLRFGQALRRHAATGEAVGPLAPPFFLASTRNAFRKSLGKAELLDDLHDTHGHCFGSDPWIAAVTQARSAGWTASRFVPASLALNGYYVFAQVDIAPDVVLH
jgi:hypothetical protein